MDYIKIITQLNEELYDRFGEVGRTFNYSTDGYVDMINFGEIILWDSENSELEWLEDEKQYEPFLPFIKKIYNQEIEKLNKHKF